MSSAALAKKRRAAPLNPQPQFTNTQQPQPQVQPKITVPQALAILDSRLSKLEKNPLENTEKSFKENDDESLQFKELISEYETRFELLVNEINSLKDTVFNLQSFTMNVNKDMYSIIKNKNFENESETLEELGEQTDKNESDKNASQDDQ